MARHPIISLLFVVVGFLLLFIGVGAFVGLHFFTVNGNGLMFPESDIAIAFIGLVCMIIGVTIWTH